MAGVRIRFLGIGLGQQDHDHQGLAYFAEGYRSSFSKSSSTVSP
jgi:hypothetical protein